MKTLIHLIVRPFLLLLIFTFPLGAQTTVASADTSIAPTANSLFHQFFMDEREALPITIETDMRKMIRQKYREEYQQTVISHYDGDSARLSREIKIRSRGDMRKKVCFYPPLKLKFKKSILQKEGLLPQHNKLKMVILCKASKTCEQYVFKEYLIYKLYNIISPYSFRVKLLTINFIDSRGKSKDRQMYGFFIEPEKELAARLGGVAIKRSKASSAILEPEPYRILAVFQYMIGNTDWSIGNMHNLKLIKVPEYPKVLPVGYDFDYAGLINTDYAVPHESLPLKTVRERLYRGRACTESETAQLMDLFNGHQAEILEYTKNFDYLDKKNKREVLKYLESFFGILEKPKRAKNIFGKK